MIRDRIPPPEEMVRIVLGLVELRKRGMISAVYVDACRVRIARRAAGDQFGYPVVRPVSWQAAAELVRVMGEREDLSLVA